MKKLLTLMPLLTFLFSCNPPTDKAKIEQQKNEQEKKARLETLNNLASHFGAVAGFDTLRFSLSYEYQNFLAKNNKIVLDKFDIDDVAKTDSIYVVSISKGYYSKLFFELTCNENQVEELLADSSQKSVKRHHRSNGKAIIVAITSIEKVKFKIDTEIESSGSEDEEPSINMDLGASNDFILKGQLIGISKK